MALNPDYVLAPSLEMYFVDKDTGAPLSAGVVTFYKDSSRSVLKPVYQLSGSPPYSSSSYTELNNPITLSSVGTFQDNNGNDILPYYYPFNTTTGEIELYYITVYSSGGVLQFTREAWPNTTSGGAEEESIVNFVPNGQFLLHNDNYLTETESTNNRYTIAQGGWYYVEPTSHSATTVVTFQRQTTPSVDPDKTSNPRYYVNINNSVGGSDTVKDLRLRFNDANKFASDDQSYTLGFQGYSNTGSTVNVDVRIIKNFGTGGSANSEVSVGTLTINPLNISDNIYSQSFVFGDNDGKTISATADDDYVEIVLRFQNDSFNVSLTDFVLALGDVTISDFPPTPNDDFLSQSTIGWLPTPNPDGSDLYLPVVVTQKGMEYDDSEVGCIISSMANTAPVGTLPCDGSTYTVSGYSSLGVPYSRLFNKIFVAGQNIPQFGTGLAFVNVAINAGSSGDEMTLFTNQPGAVAAPANGAISPGFSYGVNVSGSTTRGYRTYSNTSGYVTAIATASGSPLGLAGVSAGTSGMSATNLRDPAVSGQYFMFNLIVSSAAALGNGAGTGKYFDFASTTTAYRMWFQTATETPPAAGGKTLVKIVLDIFCTVADTSGIIANAIAAHQVYSIVCVGASSITAGSYFTFVAAITTFTVWYKKAGLGTAPAVANLIEVDIGTSSTAAQVATLTQTAINSQYFATPDLRGLFLRGTDSIPPRWDLDNVYHGNTVPASAYPSPGAVEFDTYGRHTHTITASGSFPIHQNSAGAPQNATANSSGANLSSQTVNVSASNDYQGGSETRSVNANVNWYIKY